MKHKNIAIFVPHAGCRQTCAFCNQRTITAQEAMPRAADVQRICAQAYAEISDRRHTEVAFFGGSFTAIDRGYMLELLQAVQPFLGEDGFCGIRISTRPDCISREVLELLQSFHVTAIELGAQSMCDHVLLANERGHTAKAVTDACALIREYGFSLGLQMMVGLYQSSVEDEWHTVEEICRLHPDTVRVYPVVVLKGTALAEKLKNGEYQLFSFSDTVELCARMLWKFHSESISVIKCGLHASEFVEQDMVGGFYHPAFRELCESRIYRERMEELLTTRGTRAVLAVHPSAISKAIGQKRSNLLYFQERGISVTVTGDAELKEYEIAIRE
jgi:histone acetyltransferase (RNA polymerase elongator complex component)